MTEDAVHRLLLECGFRNLMWTPLRGQRWAVVGELDGGVEITVACTLRGERPSLVVPSETARELLADMLVQNGAGEVEVLAAPSARREAPSWIPVAIGAGAVALFTWILAGAR